VQVPKLRGLRLQGLVLKAAGGCTPLQLQTVWAVAFACSHSARQMSNASHRNTVFPKGNSRACSGYKMFFRSSLFCLSFFLSAGVQHPVARVSIRFINVTTVRNYFSFALFSFFHNMFRPI
jgi:hypothetical protein